MGFLRLLVLSTLMLGSTLLASFFPLYYHFSPSRLCLISIFSTGLLIGSALGIIIPEGVEAVYGSRPEAPDAHEHGHDHSEMASWVGAGLLAGFLVMYLIDSYHPHSHSSAPSSASAPRRHQRKASLYGPPSLGRRGSSELEPLAFGRREDGEPAEGGEGKITGYEWESGDTEARVGLSSSPRAVQPSPAAGNSAYSTVIGLLLHSLADGIALGASSIVSATSGHDEGEKALDLIIFLAIMLHKAPTAFALSTLLLSSVTSPSEQDSTKNSFIRTSLLLFSLSAPVGALATYILLALFTNGETELGWYTGMVLVFSGGSFLFVAVGGMSSSAPPAPPTTVATVHSRSSSRGGASTPSPAPTNLFPAQGPSNPNSPSHLNTTFPSAQLHHDSPERAEGSVTERARLALVVLGMVTPSLLAKVVGHGH